MQTFLPYPDYAQSARVLDYRRLGKQRLECVQILCALSGYKWDKDKELFRPVRPNEKQGYANHPATLMWKGHERELIAYGRAICLEWISRGFKDAQYARISWFATLYCAPVDKPLWLGDHRFHTAHKSNLIRKDKDFYGPLWPGVPDDLPYLWPQPKYS